MLLELKRAVALRPDDAEARFRLGEALLGEGDAEAAAVQLERAVARDPGHAAARHALAKACVAQGRLTAAENVLREATRQQPGDAEARFGLADVYRRIGRPQDALLQLDVALSLDGRRLDRLTGAVDLALAQGLLRKARVWLTAARALAPDDAVLALRSSEIAAALGEQPPPRPGLRARGAAWILGRTRELLRERGVAPLVPASLAGALRGDDVTAWKRALVLAGPGLAQSPLLPLLRGEVQLASLDLAAAERSYRALAEAAPPAGAAQGAIANEALRRLAWRRLAELALDQARHGEALECARQAQPASLAPQDAAADEAVELAGDALVGLGRFDEAAVEYARIPAARAMGGVALKLGALRSRAHAVASASTAAGRVGAIRALAWSALGGAVSTVEAMVLPGAGQLVLTGNVGRIGQEAAQVAVSCVRAQGARIAPGRKLAGLDVHLHFSDHAQAKDGPSAGLALALAVASALAGRPLPDDLAATGELSLHGAVEPVGGLHEKLVAAYLEGQRRVMVPRKNVLSLLELPEELRDRLALIPVGSLEEALAQAVS